MGIESAQTRRGGQLLGIAAGAALVALAAIGIGGAPAAAAGSPGVGYARVHSVCPAPGRGEATCFALVRTTVPAAEAASPGVSRFRLRAGAATSGPAGGLTPAQLSSAYGYDPSGGGAGQTIAIVDAFDDPKIEADLAEFDAQYSLPVCTEANGCFKKVGQTGKTTALPAADKSGWSVEVSLDVEAAHAACPNCKILLVESENALLSNLAASVKKAGELGATEISNSYGGPEQFEPSAAELGDYSRPGVVIAAATGDFGYDWWAGPLPDPETPNMPASFPSVVSVGGTTLTLDEGGKRKGEKVWNGNGRLNEGGFSAGATGGGCSTFFAAPLWQRDVAGFPATGCVSKRLSADVAAVADPLTGFDIFDSYNCGKVCEEFRRGASWLTIGGTSLSTPVISALYALAGGGGGISNPALTLYGHLGDASLFDVTEGGNGYCNDKGAPCGVNAAFEERLDCEGTTACNAAAGFDGPSGVGAPASLSLFKPRLPTASIAPPAHLHPGLPAGFSAAGSTDPYPGGAAGFAYSWSWGDGTFAGGVTPSHTYAALGEYTISLTVTDGYGVKSVPTTLKVDVVEATVKEIEEEAAKRKAEEEAAKKAAEEAAASRRQAEELLARQNAEREAARRKAEEVPAASGLGVAGFKTSRPPVAPSARLAGTTLKVGPTGALTLTVSCPAGAAGCSGTVTLKTLGAVIAGSPRRASMLTLASGHFAIGGGRVGRVTLHLSRRALALVRRSGSLRARVKLVAHDAAGAGHTTLQTATLRLSRRHR